MGCYKRISYKSLKGPLQREWYEQINYSQVNTSGWKKSYRKEVDPPPPHLPQPAHILTHSSIIYPPPPKKSNNASLTHAKRRLHHFAACENFFFNQRHKSYVIEFFSCYVFIAWTLEGVGVSFLV